MKIDKVYLLYIAGEYECTCATRKAAEQAYERILLESPYLKKFAHRIDEEELIYESK